MFPNKSKCLTLLSLAFTVGASACDAESDAGEYGSDFDASKADHVGHDEKGQGHDDHGYDEHDHDEHDHDDLEPIAVQNGRVIYSEGHADLSFKLERSGTSGKFAVSLVAENATVNGESVSRAAYPIENVTILTNAQLRAPTGVARDVLSPLCFDLDGDTPTYWLPQRNSDARVNNAPFMGFDADADIAIEGGAIAVSLVSVEGPGNSDNYAMWQDGFPPRVGISTCDWRYRGFELALGHDHFNHGFTGAPGTWSVTYQVNATLEQTGEDVSAQFTVNYGVGISAGSLDQGIA